MTEAATMERGANGYDYQIAKVMVVFPKSPRCNLNTLPSWRSLLVLRRGDDDYEAGRWDLFGGTLEDGEDPLACVVREAGEESKYMQLDPSKLRRLSTLEGRDKRDRHYKKYLFVGRLPGLPRVELTEHSKMRGFKLPEVPKILDHPIWGEGHRRLSERGTSFLCGIPEQQGIALQPSWTYNEIRRFLNIGRLVQRHVKV